MSLIAEGAAYQLYLGDCLQIMRGMEAGSVDITIIDPPYGIKMDGGFSDTGKAGIIPRKNSVRQYAGNWDSKRPTKDAFDSALIASKSLFVFGGNFFADLLPVSNHWIVWDKVNTMPTFSDAELIWTNVKRDSVKMIRHSTNGLLAIEKDRVHPTQKPVAVLRWIIENYTKPGDLVADFYMGSGTTGVACMQLGRRFVGCEIDPDYFQIAKRRISQASAQPLLIPPARMASMEQGKF